jgi:hypothetical protein
MKTSLVLSLVTTLVVASVASAHFVWIESSPTAAGLQIRSGFGEPEGWDPDLVDRMSRSKFWTRAGGTLKPLEIAIDKTEREYRTVVTGKSPDAVLAAADFGVVQFGPNPPSWLRYTAKHLTGVPETWNEDTPSKDLRIEVTAKRVGDDVVLRVVHLGKPLSQASIKAFPPSQSGEKVELTTDEDGVAKWPAKASGNYALYVGTTVPATGEIDGKKYEALKDYATLTFRIP